MIERMVETLDSGEDSFEDWGTGKAIRDFLHVDDAAIALHLLLEFGSPASVTNVGSGREMSIFESTRSLARISGFSGKIKFGKTRPDGSPRRVLDIGRLKKLGWLGPTNFESQLADVWAFANMRDKTFEP